ncbi:MAG: 1-acyl-sn-glycerol-3-phosphate acyltransferase [Myxococcales bacterium]|nr:1-acyl-sn-glycerol-3-phosphate acyltransferase [Myxococcales bacterium]
MSLVDSEFWSALTWTERVACAVGATFARTRAGRRAATFYQDHVSVPVWNKTLDDRMHVHGLEHLPRDRSFIFAANHRSYFDLYAVLLATWHHFDQSPHLYCPVRTTFFYERPLGVALNVAVCANAMYPPVFRDDRGRVLNQRAVDLAVELLETDPRTVLAMHPEGKRNKGDDPYSYLPPKPGVGRIALRAGAPVVPVYVGGLPAKFGALVKERVSGKGTPVRVRLGAPVPLADLYADADDPAAQREAAERTMAAIAALGEEDRAFVARLSRGDRSADSPRSTTSTPTTTPA